MADDSSLTRDKPDNGATGVLARRERQHPPPNAELLAESVLAEDQGRRTMTDSLRVGTRPGMLNYPFSYD